MDKFYTAVVIIVLTGFAGWVSNIIQVISMDSIVGNALGAVKLVGIFIAPLGSVMGIIGWF